MILKSMRERYPDDDLCWIDADMLVLDNLARHFWGGHINVMAHGRRDGESVPCGLNLTVPGERYPIGGMWSIPPGPALQFMLEAARDFPNWVDQGGRNPRMPDQLILNHLVHRAGLPVHWLSDDDRYVFNLAVAENLHPVVGDSKLAEIRLNQGRFISCNKYLAVFCWIKNKLDAHLEDGFSTFAADVQSVLLRYYS